MKRSRYTLALSYLPEYDKSYHTSHDASPRHTTVITRDLQSRPSRLSCKWRQLSETVRRMEALFLLELLLMLSETGYLDLNGSGA
jgi:hypothetical protein